ncbi:hypothetical protein [Camelimonas lactis]|uniref:Uncharacterized protein n=1 Tax=Camelimonas lactis TaxID=659006 RepID=A0A4R2GSW7_9HYPH|nr:hypothetical protein [Camelimonas lactis]TCO13442.1 hypothetical protein EV666_106155 [Camelimonas lactis]
MTDVVQLVGSSTKNFILWIAASLAGDAVPGFIALVLLLLLLISIGCAVVVYRRKIGAISALRGLVERADSPSFAEAREAIDDWAEAPRKAGKAKTVADAWKEFSETLVLDEISKPPTLRNSVRPTVFFNIEDLHFGGGFFRIVPGLFVSAGLALTFLGLIAALNSMGSGGAINDATMSHLLKIASAKFIMSLTGLACSIIFTIVLRGWTGRLEKELHRLCFALEKKLSFVSLEFIGYEQLRAFQEAREHNRQLTTEVIAELGRPLREDLPAAISSSIGAAMEPLLERIGQQGSDSMSTLASDLSSQLTSSIGAALTAASDKLAQAGDRIGALSDRMDQSSGRIGTEMEQAVARVAAAVEDLRAGMAASASETSGVFSQGAEQMMAAMTKTLEAIRENTADGAKAMSSAAEAMRSAATEMRAEMENAAKSGAEAAKERMLATSAQASAAIDSAGRSVLDSFGKAGVEIAQLTGQFSGKFGQELLEPIGKISSRLDEMVGAIEEGATEVRRASDAVREGAKAGAEAAGNFRAAAQELTGAALPIRATSERIEGSVRLLSDGMRDGLATISRSAEATVQNAAQILDGARIAVSAEREGMERSLAAFSDVLSRMRGQGDRLDDMDQKLGRAFDLYTATVEAAIQALHTHVRDMSVGLGDAVSKIDNAIQQLQDFTPEQGRR